VGERAERAATQANGKKKKEKNHHQFYNARVLRNALQKFPTQPNTKTHCK